MARIYVEDPAARDPRFSEAEQQAQKDLLRYFRSDFGVQAHIARETGIKAPMLSRMANQGGTIALEAAILIELASDGALRAEQLCPSRAEVLTQFLQRRCAQPNEPAEA